MITILDSKPSGYIVSASQVKTYSRCNRKWGFKYIDKLPDPVGRGAIFGTAVHTELEKYFGSHTAPSPMTREGKLALHGIDSGLYPLDLTFEVETHFYFEIEGVNFQGYIDLMWNDHRGLTVCDHKTSSNPKKYGLSDDELSEDGQGLIYAIFGLDRDKLDHVRLQWTYLETAQRVKPKIFATVAELDRAHVESRFRLNVLGTAKEIANAKATAKTGNDLEPNPDACGDFGGCPFSDHCVLNRAQKLTSVFGEKGTGKAMGTLREMLAAKRSGKLHAPPRVNSPEHKAGVEASREASKAVGAVEGGRDAQKAGSRAIANATAAVTDPGEAKAAAEKALGGANADREAKAASSMDKKQVLLALFYGPREGVTFTHAKPKATAAMPYVSGRTSSSMAKATPPLITVTNGEGVARIFKLTEAGVAEAEKHVAPGTASAPVQPAAAASDHTNEAGRVADHLNAVGDKLGNTPEPSRTDDEGKPTTTPFASVTVNAPATAKTTINRAAVGTIAREVITVDPFHVEHSDFFKSLLANTEFKTEDAIAKFDAYVARFPMGAA